MATKRFNGKLYHSRGITGVKKSQAKKTAESFRKWGDLARVVPHDDGWSAFVHTPRKQRKRMM